MTSIDDEQFKESLTLREAYLTMYEFLAAYHNRGNSDTGALLGDVSLLQDGSTLDPAQLQDFLDAFEKVKKGSGS